MLPGMCDLRVRVRYSEADLRVRVRGFEPTCESESEVLSRPANQSQRFWRTKSNLRVRVRGFGGQKATCESESAILQGHLHGQGFRLRSIQLKVECLAACGGEGMLLRKCSHVWQRSSPRSAHHVPASQSQMFSIMSYCDSHGHRRRCGATAHRVSTYAGWPS
jgi:hypothetical protein